MALKLDVRRANAEKKYEGELETTFEADGSLVPIPFVTFASPVTAKLRYAILEDDSVEVTGTISFTLKGSCSRCLKETQQVFESETEGYFVPGGEDGEDYSYTNGVIDFGEFLRDSVMFAMPSRLVCSENCAAPDYK